MAAINEKDKLLVQQTATPAAQATVPQQQVTPYTGLAGVSESTGSQLGKYSGGYTPSAAVSQAQKYLSDVVAGKPAAYRSSYKQQLDDLYSQVMNRPKFSYNVGADPLYNQYRDQYMNLGSQAMMDTTAQAAALSGGYSNSYAASAGNQAYQAYLQQLNNVVPELYQMAMQQYQQEGDDLNNRYAMTADLENQAYGRYQDDMARWDAERNYASSDYWNQYNADYGAQQDQLSYWSQIAAQENAQWNANRELAYNQAMAILQTGKTPSSELLAAAGISAADAKKLAEAYKPKSSGGSSRKSSSSGGYVPQTTPDAPKEVQLGTFARDVYQWMNSMGASAKDKNAAIDKYTKQTDSRVSTITADEAYTIKKKLGLI